MVGVAVVAGLFFFFVCFLVRFICLLTFVGWLVGWLVCLFVYVFVCLRVCLFVRFVYVFFIMFCCFGSNLLPSWLSFRFQKYSLNSWGLCWTSNEKPTVQIILKGLIQYTCIRCVCS